MNRREKAIGLTLLCTLLASAGLDPLEEMVLGPITSLRGELNEAQKRLQQLELDQRAADRRLQSFAALKAQGLPRETAIASVQYQEYLMRALEQCGMQSPVVNGDNPLTLEGVGSRLNFAVQASATAEQLGNFLDFFHATEVMHRMNYVNIFQSGGAESPVHSVVMNIEVLVLDGDDSKRTAKLEPSSDRTELAALLAAKDIFKRPSPPPPIFIEPVITEVIVSAPPVESPYVVPIETVAPPPVEIPIELAVATPEDAPFVMPIKPPAPLGPTPQETVRFVGVIDQETKRLALFFDTNTTKQLLIGDNESLDSLGIDAVLTKVDRDSLQLKTDEGEVRLELGQCVADASAKE